MRCSGGECWGAGSAPRGAWSRECVSGRGESPGSSPEPPGRQTLPRARPSGRSWSVPEELPGPRIHPAGDPRGGGARTPSALNALQGRRSSAPSARQVTPRWAGTQVPLKPVRQRSSVDQGQVPVKGLLWAAYTSRWSGLLCSDSLGQKFLLLREEKVASPDLLSPKLPPPRAKIVPFSPRDTRWFLLPGDPAVSAVRARREPSGKLVNPHVSALAGHSPAIRSPDTWMKEGGCLALHSLLR